MVVDTSAIIAIFGDEPGSEKLTAQIQAASLREMSVVSYVEAASVLWTRGISPADLDDLLGLFDIALVPVDEAQGREAIRARIAYGKGSGHRAKLNLGDTFTYALAKTRGAPVLFVGDDFRHTDLVDALS